MKDFKIIIYPKEEAVIIGYKCIINGEEYGNFLPFSKECCTNFNLNELIFDCLSAAKKAEDEISCFNKNNA